MRSRRQFAAIAFSALFVALSLVAAQHAASLRSRPVPDRPARSRALPTAEASLAPVIAISVEPAQRVFSFGAAFAFLAAGSAIVAARLLRVGGGAPIGSFRRNVGRRYRGRAPPFARA